MVAVAVAVMVDGCSLAAASATGASKRQRNRYKSKTSFGIDIFYKLHLFGSTLNPSFSVDTKFHAMMRISS